MAGTGTDTPRGISIRPMLAGALAAVLIALALLALRGAAQPAAAEAQVSCPALPTGLSPPGDPSTRFTMLIRINTQQNVDTYANPVEADGGLGGRIRAQDIFVINT